MPTERFDSIAILQRYYCERDPYLAGKMNRAFRSLSLEKRLRILRRLEREEQRRYDREYAAYRVDHGH